ncbi:MAG TPA: hypothetical protein VN578_21595 [Candidatus Binatia bacterium]|jgi:hypothetical protein|nr:hypothetical protein [Candidatus Binatia bacterium]
MKAQACVVFTLIELLRAVAVLAALAAMLQAAPAGTTKNILLERSLAGPVARQIVKEEQAWCARPVCIDCTSC